MSMGKLTAYNNFNKSKRNITIITFCNRFPGLPGSTYLGGERYPRLVTCFQKKSTVQLRSKAYPRFNKMWNDTLVQNPRRPTTPWSDCAVGLIFRPLGRENKTASWLWEFHYFSSRVRNRSARLQYPVLFSMDLPFQNGTNR